MWKRRLFWLLLGSLSLPANAARPFVTDDARLTTAGSCQLESWTRAYRHSQEYWALPACNPGGNFELTLGGGHATSSGENSSRDVLVQGKTLFRPLQSNDWGWGLALGHIYHPAINPGPNLFGNTYFYLPASFSFNDDKLIVHTNLGLLHDKASDRNSGTWGIGGEFQLTPRLLGIAEGFGDSRHNPYWQIGARYAIVPDRIQIDATVGQQYNGPSASRWISFGLRLTPDRLF